MGWGDVRDNFVHIRITDVTHMCVRHTEERQHTERYGETDREGAIYFGVGLACGRNSTSALSNKWESDAKVCERMDK